MVRFYVSQGIDCFNIRVQWMKKFKLNITKGQKMKKFIVLVLILITSPALSRPVYVPSRQHYYHGVYNNGYRAGKHHAYNNIVRTVALVGFATVAGVIIYQAGKDSRWTMTEDGNIGYRF